MNAICEALVEGIPAEARVRLACRGRWQSYVETETGAGVASLLIPGKQPYRDAEILTGWAGRPLRDLAAALSSDGWEQSRAMGCAAVNAWYNALPRLRRAGAELHDPASPEGHVFTALEPETRGRVVSTVGHFHGSALFTGAKEIRIFEKEPQPGDYPEEAEEERLPGSDLVIITGMALTNGTLPRLLELCAGARVVLSGPSVPVTPLWFSHGVDALFGTAVWDVPRCRRAARQGGHKETWKYMGKAVLTR